MQIGFSRRFKKQYKKPPVKIQKDFDKRVSMYISNSSHSLLKIHKLHGSLAGLYSLNVNGDIRAIFEKISENKIEFISIGSHSKLYS